MVSEHNTDDIRQILTAAGERLQNLDIFVAENLKFTDQIYIAPGVTWLETGAPLEVQVVDGGDDTIQEGGDREGSVRRAQVNIVIAIMLRRPRQTQGKHATILTEIDANIQTYVREIRKDLDGCFLPYNQFVGEEPEELLVRPLVYMGSPGIQTLVAYPDLHVKELRFTGGVNDGLIH